MNARRDIEGWLLIADYPLYEVSSLGRVRSWIRGGPEALVLKQFHGHGYPRVNLYPARGGRARSVVVHKLVLEAFVGPRPDGMVACHNNGNQKDNRPDNLRWGTVLDNAADKTIHGTVASGERHGSRTRPDRVGRGDRHSSRTNIAARPRGESHPYSRLTEHTAALAVWIGSYVRNRCAIARVLGVPTDSVRNCLNGVTWKHLFGTDVERASRAGGRR